MPYKHGIYVAETATRLSAPVTSQAGLIVAVGTAPKGEANTPILANSYAEAVQALGYSDNFARYTLCEAVSAAFQVMGAGPLVLINVLDPARHRAVFEETLQVSARKVALTAEGILLDTLSVRQGAETEALERGTDYTAELGEDGAVVITLLETGEAASAATLKVSGYRLDPSAVTAADIVGGVNESTGKETGLEVLRQVYPKLGLVPGILIAPRWSMEPTVTAALQAKTKQLNGLWRCAAVVDVDSRTNGARKYTGVSAAKTAQGLTSEDVLAVWPCVRVGEAVYSGSSIAAALAAYTDAQNGGLPNVSPSNRAVPVSGVCLADGTEILLDLEQANTVNGYGVATFLNLSGFRLWGNNTAAYPTVTDTKDRWWSVRRFMSWAGDSFILTHIGRVDSPASPQMIEAIVDAENARGNAFVSRGACARYECEYDAEASDPAAGQLTFRIYCTPYPPAEDIEAVLEFDTAALNAALS